MNNQEAFDISCKGILSQGGPALLYDKSCAYRAGDGKKCAAGWLIKDEDYDPMMENKQIDTLMRPSARYNLPYLRDVDINLLIELQNAHDHVLWRSFDYWKIEVASIAKRFNLDTSAITNG